MPGPPVSITAGPDVHFELEGLSQETLQTAIRWSAGGHVEAQPPPEQAELRDLLIGLGALKPIIPDLGPLPIIGKPGDLLTLALEARDLKPIAVEAPLADAPLHLVLRTSSSWPDSPPGVHLGVDLTHHHTLVLGPLVVPGVTSCLMCLERQTSRRWGQDRVTKSPAIRRWPELTAELITLQIELARSGESALVNATIAWDLAHGNADRQDLLRAPQCGGPCRAPSSDQIDLPWLSP